METHLQEYWKFIVQNYANFKRFVLAHFLHRFVAHNHLDFVDIILMTIFITMFFLWVLHLLKKLRKIYRYQGIIQSVKNSLFKCLRKIPFVEKKVHDELDKTLKELEEEVNKLRPDKIVKIPSQGIKRLKLQEKLISWNTRDEEFRNNKHMTGCMYAREDDEVINFIKQYSQNNLYANPLHFEIFPSAMQMEAELISMTAHLYNGNKETSGIVTTGGTESILLACLAYRDLAYEKGIKEPDMVIPKTAHAAFNKAAWYFGIKVVTVDCDKKSGKVLVGKLKSAISSNTCMVVASVPNYPNGNIDDVELIAAYCQKKKIPLHVDCCLGGFLAPFAEACGIKFPRFDFRVPGVTSISCDHHKYGLAPKGVSVVMFKNAKLRAHCMFSITTWPGGIYATPGICGSKGGAASTGAWIAMCYLGFNGYKEKASAIFTAQAKFLKTLGEIPELRVIGNPCLGTLAITSNSRDLNIYAVLDSLIKKGWHLNGTQDAIQFLMNYCNIQFLDDLIKDLKESVKVCKGNKEMGADNKWARLYATNAKLPTELMEEGSKIALESFLKI